MSFKGLLARYSLLYLISIIIFGISLHLLGFTANKATNAGMLFLALGAARQWHSVGNGKSLDDSQLIIFALFAIVMDNLYLTFATFMYLNALGTPNSVDQSFDVQFQVFGISDIVLICTFIYLSKKEFSKVRVPVVQPAQHYIQTKELNWRSPTAKSNDEKIEET